MTGGEMAHINTKGWVDFIGFMCNRVAQYLGSDDHAQSLKYLEAADFDEGRMRYFDIITIRG